MSVVLRLSRHGRKKIPHYRIVAAQKERCRDGKFLEQLGTMDPLKNPALVNLKEDRVKHWIGVGAQPSDTVAQIIERQYPGYLSEIEKNRESKIRSTRAKRRARQAKSAKPKAAKAAGKSKAAKAE